jgi:drug/metabolite transporter (DMT)-like permease
VRDEAAPERNTASSIETKAASTTGMALAAFILVVVTGGANGVAIRYSLRDGGLEPFWGASARFLLAAAIFFIMAAAVRAPMPREHALRGALLFGALTFGGGFAFVYWGLTRTPAGLAQVILALIPLFTFVFAILHRQERFRWDGLAGALIAVGGIGVIFISAADADVPALSVVAIVAGAECIAEAAVIA